MRSISDKWAMFGIGCLAGCVVLAAVVASRIARQDAREDRGTHGIAVAPGLTDAAPLPKQVPEFFRQGRMVRYAVLNDEAPQVEVWVVEVRNNFPYVRMVRTIADAPPGSGKIQTVDIGYMAAGQVLVAAHPGVSNRDLQEAVDALGYRMIDYNRQLQRHVIALGSIEPDAVPHALQRLRALPEVREAGPDVILPKDEFQDT